ncbi:hypothetical protein CORC01_03757 [Colletotrichum orchidophilum]|uniref:Uncharacterized protein n=1 Tax=Colletotrichum orchidophilum TaxID=1209926 RepID=A0A1G4BHN2_9PEZI|nr:uncharacterized protein CORC01_03757 [Colletotrichum orchidophilum]OHF00929.1 hypothetical protein CORC01_03757 [Colletotrichum orchidophilum]
MATFGGLDLPDNLRWDLDRRWEQILAQSQQQGQREEAEAAAVTLLMEPGLSSLQRAGLHTLLASSPKDYVEHVSEAVRLYNMVINSIQLSLPQRAELQARIDSTEILLAKARQDKIIVDRAV